LQKQSGECREKTIKNEFMSIFYEEKKMVYTVVIDGIIGCGKSSLIKQLNDFTCFEEPVHEWSLLPDFYTNMPKYAACFQYQVLFSYHKLYSTFKNVNDTVILERCPWTSKHIFAEMLVDKNLISSDEYNVYSSFYDKVAFPTDIYIYLKVDPMLAYQRILSRDRPAEKLLQFEYLQQLDQKYEKAFSNLNNVFVVDANQSMEMVQTQVLSTLKTLRQSKHPNL
jgi:deoxyadenosine/deoxycytidine kinase